MRGAATRRSPAFPAGSDPFELPDPAARVRSAIQPSAGGARGHSRLRIHPRRLGTAALLVAACVVVALLRSSSGKYARLMTPCPSWRTAIAATSVMSTFPPDATPQRPPRQPDAAAASSAEQPPPASRRRARSSLARGDQAVAGEACAKGLCCRSNCTQERTARSFAGRCRGRAGTRASADRRGGADGPGGRPVDADERRALAVHAGRFHFARHLRSARALPLLQRLLGYVAAVSGQPRAGTRLVSTDPIRPARPIHATGRRRVCAFVVKRVRCLRCVLQSVGASLQ